MAVAGGAVVGAAPAHADSAAGGGSAGSPGLISGNTIQLPVHIPVNVCGNTVDAAGLLNPAAGNSCANRSQGAKRPAKGGAGHKAAPGGHGGRTGGSGGANGGGATALGGGKDSPGLLSGNTLQLPVDLPVNVTGNSVSVVGIGNAAVGNESTNTPGPGTRPEPRPGRPKPEARPAHPEPHRPAPRHVPALGPTTALAHTGADPLTLAVPAGLALLAGTVLYRRFRAPAPTGH
ncbi:chaplin [Streptomyces sp. NPDC091292]|uniref:chaplin n=1 Tax=Streptomyces sp. NPDC091292 TaxID=3365991 RepID=UPI00381B5E5C